MLFTPSRPDSSRLPRKKRKCRWRQVCTGSKSFAKMTKSLKEMRKKKQQKTRVAQFWRWASPIKNGTLVKGDKGPQASAAH